jgi:hypothetical protein
MIGISPKAVAKGTKGAFDGYFSSYCEEPLLVRGISNIKLYLESMYHAYQAAQFLVLFKMTNASYANSRAAHAVVISPPTHFHQLVTHSPCHLKH